MGKAKWILVAADGTEAAAYSKRDLNRRMAAAKRLGQSVEVREVKE